MALAETTDNLATVIDRVSPFTTVSDQHDHMLADVIPATGDGSLLPVGGRSTVPGDTGNHLAAGGKNTADTYLPDFALTGSDSDQSPWRIDDPMNKAQLDSDAQELTKSWQATYNSYEQGQPPSQAFAKFNDELKVACSSLTPEEIQTLAATVDSNLRKNGLPDAAGIALQTVLNKTSDPEVALSPSFQAQPDGYYNVSSVIPVQAPLTIAQQAEVHHSILPVAGNGENPGHYAQQISEVRVSAEQGALFPESKKPTPIRFDPILQTLTLPDVPLPFLAAPSAAPPWQYPAFTEPSTKQRPLADPVLKELLSHLSDPEPGDPPLMVSSHPWIESGDPRPLLVPDTPIYHTPPKPNPFIEKPLYFTVNPYNPYDPPSELDPVVESELEAYERSPVWQLKEKQAEEQLQRSREAQTID